MKLSLSSHVYVGPRVDEEATLKYTVSSWCHRHDRCPRKGSSGPSDEDSKSESTDLWSRASSPTGPLRPEKTPVCQKRKTKNIRELKRTFLYSIYSKLYSYQNNAASSTISEMIGRLDMIYYLNHD